WPGRWRGRRRWRRRGPAPVQGRETRRRKAKRQAGAGGASAGFQTKEAPGFTPRFLKTHAAGQKPVKLACNMLKPANAVSQSHAGWTQVASARLPSTTSPAKRNTAVSSVIARLLLLEAELAEAERVHGELFVEGLAG